MKQRFSHKEKRAILKKLYKRLHEAKNSIFVEDYKSIKRQIENIKYFY